MAKNEIPVTKINAIEADGGVYVELRSLMKFLDPDDAAAFVTALALTSDDIYSGAGPTLTARLDANDSTVLAIDGAVTDAAADAAAAQATADAAQGAASSAKSITDAIRTASGLLKSDGGGAGATVTAVTPATGALVGTTFTGAGGGDGINAAVWAAQIQAMESNINALIAAAQAGGL